MIVGIGIDVCPVDRFASAAARASACWPGCSPRPSGTSSMNRMAGRFAAKEALAKALGASGG